MPRSDYDYQFYHPEYGEIHINTNNFGNGGGFVTSPVGNTATIIVDDWTFYYKSDRFFIDRDRDTLKNYLLLLPRSRAAMER